MMRIAFPITMVLTMGAVLTAVAVERDQVQLLEGDDFSGWVRFLPNDDVSVDDVWTLEDGVLRCTGKPAGYIRTTDRYANYRLSLQWRWPDQPGNNGLLLHVQDPDEVWPKSIEVQMQHEHAGDFWVIGGADFREHVNKEHRRVKKRHNHNEKPLGEWNTMEVFCWKDTIVVTVNGLVQNVATDVTVTEGFIALQSEGAPIEYRNMVLVPLEPASQQ